jgi:predicted ferric reductase
MNHGNVSRRSALLTSQPEVSESTTSEVMDQPNVSRRSAIFYTMPNINDPDANVEKRPNHQPQNSGSDVSGNDPHEALEFPPIYFLLKSFPRLLQGFEVLYRIRWKLTYPLQKRIPLQCKIFHKVHISSVTYGEVLWILPFIAILFFGIFTSFIRPNVFLSGHMARLPLAIAIVTASRNSIVTFLFGFPFERCIFYHKLAARLALINGIFHTFVCYVNPFPGAIHGLPSEHTFQGESPNFFLFAFDGRINIAGSCIFLLMFAIIITSLPIVRRRLFEVFQFLHVLFVLGMVCCAFFHSGGFVVILASIAYGGDLLIRKVLMAYMLYPHKAYLRKLTESVLEISFPKTKSVNYNPGQYLIIAVPNISILQWHPFSISSSPHQDIVTLNIRVCGNWTRELEKLAEENDCIDILCEGPYGSLGVDLISKDRYKIVMFLSGGIGVTPMQSICHQLMYEHTMGKREVKRIWFLWTARDPDMLENMEVSRRSVLDREGSLQKLARRFSLNSFWSFHSSSRPEEASVSRSRQENTVIHQRRYSLDSVVSQLTEDPTRPDTYPSSVKIAINPATYIEPKKNTSLGLMRRSTLDSLFGGTVIRDSEEAYHVRRNSCNGAAGEPVVNNDVEKTSQILSFSSAVANILLTEFSSVAQDMRVEDEEFHNALEELSTQQLIEKPAVFKMGHGPTWDTRILKGATLNSVEHQTCQEEDDHNSFNSCVDFSVTMDIKEVPTAGSPTAAVEDAAFSLDPKSSSRSPLGALSGTSSVGIPSNMKRSLSTATSSMLEEVAHAGIPIVSAVSGDEPQPNVGLSGNDDGPLRLELFLTGKKEQRRDSLVSQFTSSGRPNFKKSFENMKEEAIKMGEKRIAVCVCAPAVLVTLCKQACAEYSDRKVRFDFHSETFG